MKQLSFSDAEYGGKRKRTRREVFLAEMQRAVPWAELEALIGPHYPKAGGGRRPYPLSTMLRIHCLQQWYGLSDPAMEEELYEIASMRQFAGLSLARGTVPDATTILNFRHLPEQHGLAREIFDTVKAHLQAAGLLLRQGTIVDAKIIAAPSSTKNSTGKRDPEMHQTRKGNQWYFGMKAHVGVDAESGLVHSAIGTPANVADVTKARALLHGGEAVAFGDAGYIGVEQRPEHHGCVEWQVAMKPGKRRALRKTKRADCVKRIEHLKAQVRARGEHAFRVIKRQFGHLKVRYRGLTKNTAQLHTLFALANIWMVRRQLLAAG
ncbi:MAG: IS5 family transposase [Pseudomonadota bacterium]